jgi:hypothetical protein
MNGRRIAILCLVFAATLAVGFGILSIFSPAELIAGCGSC